MSKILPILFILVMIIAPCAAVIALGPWFRRRASRVSPDSMFVRKLTPTGIALNTGFALFLLVGTVVRLLAPQSEIGALLGTPTQMSLVLFVLWVLFTAGSVVASKLGHSISQKLRPNDLNKLLHRAVETAARSELRERKWANAKCRLASRYLPPQPIDSRSFMERKFTVDPEVMRAWSQNCAVNSRETLWLWPLALLSTVGPIAKVVTLGASYFIGAFVAFSVGLLVIGVILSIKAPQVFCPHCGRRPLRWLKLYRYHLNVSPLSADYCEHCFYWLRESSVPGVSA